MEFKDVGISSQQMKALLEHFKFDFIVDSVALDNHGIRYYRIIKNDISEILCCFKYTNSKIKVIEI